VQNDLQRGQYQSVARLFQEWGRKEIDVAALRLTSPTATRSASTNAQPGRAQFGAGNVHPILLPGEARLLLVKDLAPVEDHRRQLILVLGSVFLILAVLLTVLTVPCYSLAGGRCLAHPHSRA